MLYTYHTIYITLHIYVIICVHMYMHMCVIYIFYIIYAYTTYNTNKQKSTENPTYLTAL